MGYKIKIKQKVWLTHDVIQFIMEKPDGFDYVAGQAVEVTIDDPDFKDDWAPFTLTSLNKNDNLEFIIKSYPQHRGMTLALSKLDEGDHFIITDPWDSFKDKGPGVFIAGGTGVTPFIALLRQMKEDGTLGASKLIFSNKNEKDIFLQDEFSRILGDNFIQVLTREKKRPFLYGRVNKKFLSEHIKKFNRHFYLCGPNGFVKEIGSYLRELGIKDDLVSVSL